MGRNKGYDRMARVGQQVHEVLASALLMDVRDPRVRDVQITHVDVSPDLRSARVYYIVMDGEDPRPEPEVQEGLDTSAGFLKRTLGERLRMKYVPDLNFTYDESVERGRRIEELLAGVEPEPTDDASED